MIVEYSFENFEDDEPFEKKHHEKAESHKDPEESEQEHKTNNGTF